MTEKKGCPWVKTNIVQNIFRIIIGLFMIYAGIGHLTFNSVAFEAQVPQWLATDAGFKVFVVYASGIVEILLGAAMVYGGQIKIPAGVFLAIFYVLVFPGNIAQYVNGVDAFGLNTDTKRLIRLFFQPVLVLWSLWSSGAIKYWLMSRKTK